MAEERAIEMRRYYEARAPEYDATTYELARVDETWARDVEALERFVRSLPAGRVLDVGCGTGWLTRFLRGPVVALDASEAMLAEARKRLPGTELVLAAAPPLPFPERSFELVFSAHLYGHLERVCERRKLVREALRVGRELVVVEQPRRPGVERETLEERELRDGSVHRVYKRYLTAEELADELGGTVVFETTTFVAVRTSQRVNG